MYLGMKTSERYHPLFGKYEKAKIKGSRGIYADESLICAKMTLFFRKRLTVSSNGERGSSMTLYFQDSE